MDTPTVAQTMASLITTLASVASAVITQMTAVATWITATPLALLTVGMLFLGSAVSMVGKVYRKC